jgi:two-component system sensor histidine kinase/response regulator
MSMATKKIRVLVVDDDEDDFLIIRHFITNIPNLPYELEWVASVDEAIKRIEKHEHDVYLIDYRLGEQTGLELLRSVNMVDRSEPFIILTGVGDDRVEQDAMKLGAADYLVKGTFDSELLSRVLRHSIQRKQMEVQRVQQLMDLNRSKDEFIALASHQLRTPATAVKQYVSMVLEGYAGGVNEEQQALLQSAYDSNERQILIVNDILRVAKLDLDKIVLNKKHARRADYDRYGQRIYSYGAE